MFTVKAKNLNEIALQYTENRAVALSPRDKKTAHTPWREPCHKLGAIGPTRR